MYTAPPTGVSFVCFDINLIPQHCDRLVDWQTDTLTDIIVETRETQNV